MNQEERQRRRELNKLASINDVPLPYPHDGVDMPRVIQAESEKVQKYSEYTPSPVKSFREMQDVYINWAHKYRNYIPSQVVKNCELESYKKTIKTYKPGDEISFKQRYTMILRRKLDHAKKQAALPRRITDIDVIEDLRYEIEFDDNFMYSIASIFELEPELLEEHSELKTLKKNERKYAALLCNLEGIPFDKLAAQELGITRKAITDIKKRITQKLGDGWEKKLLPGRYE